MRAISERCQGAGHMAAGNKPCQDYCFARAEGPNAIGIVSDGHGGARYFRSETGSRLAADVTRECVRDFIRDTDKALFCNAPLTQRKALTAGPGTPDRYDVLFRELFVTIRRKWHEAIARDADENPVTDAEKAKVRPEYIKAFMSRDGSGRRTGLDETYGCTLICFARTASYWFAFHIGDGKCIAFSPDGKWSEPVPWDDEGCFLNSTTSLCNEGAEDEFRYCFGGKDTFPMAVFLGSDGLDGSFGELPDLANFYANILKAVWKSSDAGASKELKEALPELSRMGSQDDMSVVCCYDESVLGPAVSRIIRWQIGNIMARREQLLKEIDALKDRISSYSGRPDLTPKEEADRAHSEKKLDSDLAEMKALGESYISLNAELEAAGGKPVNVPGLNDAVMEKAGSKAAAEPNPAVTEGRASGHKTEPNPAFSPVSGHGTQKEVQAGPREGIRSTDAASRGGTEPAEGAARGRSIMLFAELIFIVLVFAGAALFLKSYIVRNDADTGAAGEGPSAAMPVAAEIMPGSAYGSRAAPAESGAEAGGYNPHSMTKGGVTGFVIEAGIFTTDRNAVRLIGIMRQPSDQAVPAGKVYLSDVFREAARFFEAPAEDSVPRNTWQDLIIKGGYSAGDESGAGDHERLPSDESVKDPGNEELPEDVPAESGEDGQDTAPDTDAADESVQDSGDEDLQENIPVSGGDDGQDTAGDADAGGAEREARIRR